MIKNNYNRQIYMIISYMFWKQNQSQIVLGLTIKLDVRQRWRNDPVVSENNIWQGQGSAALCTAVWYLHSHLIACLGCVAVNAFHSLCFFIKTAVARLVSSSQLCCTPSCTRHSDDYWAPDTACFLTAAEWKQQQKIISPAFFVLSSLLLLHLTEKGQYFVWD